MNQRGFTILELMMVVCIIGVLSMISMTEFNKVGNRAYVGAALSDVQVLRKAISMYDAEWGAFPAISANDVVTLVSNLRDPFGQPYLDNISDRNFKTFSYELVDPADPYGDYTIVVTCNDTYSTQITIHWDSVPDIVKGNV